MRKGKISWYTPLLLAAALSGEGCSGHYSHRSFEYLRLRERVERMEETGDPEIHLEYPALKKKLEEWDSRRSSSR